MPDFDWLEYDAPSPIVPLRVPLSRARVALISTAGAHAPDQRAQGATGKAYVVPVDTDVVFSHPGFDTNRAASDPNVVWPAEPLRRLAQQGVIGELSPNAVATMGGVLIGSRIIERAMPVAVMQCIVDKVDLAFVVPACPVCQRRRDQPLRPVWRPTGRERSHGAPRPPPSLSFPLDQLGR